MSNPAPAGGAGVRAFRRSVVSRQNQQAQGAQQQQGQDLAAQPQSSQAAQSSGNGQQQSSQSQQQNTQQAQTSQQAATSGQAQSSGAASSAAPTSQAGGSSAASGAAGQTTSAPASGQSSQSGSASASSSSTVSHDDGGEWASVSQAPVTTTFAGNSSPSDYIGGIAKTKAGGTLSPGAKGGIAGGIVGGIAAIILAFVLWRMCRGRGKKLPPPAPREMTEEYRPPSYARPSTQSRGPSMTMSRSYSTLLGPPQRPLSHFDSYSSTSSQKYGASTPSGSPSLSSAGTGTHTPGGAPPVTVAGAPLNLYRDGSSASSGSGSGEQHLVSHGSNGRLARGASGDQLSAPSDDSRTNSSDSRTNSPRPSSLSLGSSGLRRSVPGMPRYPSQTLRGAPHTGRQVTITVPRPLSSTSLSSDSPTVYASYSGYQRGSPRGSQYSAPGSRVPSGYGEFGAPGPSSSAPIVQSGGHRRGRSNPPSLATPPEGMYNGRETIV